MDTQKYFGQSEADMIASIKTYSGDEMKHADWKKAMTAFLNSSESESVQNKAASAKFNAGLKTPISKGGWTTPREICDWYVLFKFVPKVFRTNGSKIRMGCRTNVKSIL